MKIKCDIVVTNLKGEPFVANGEQLTVRGVITSSLLGDFKEAEGWIQGDDKHRRFKLAQKFFMGEEVEVSNQELQLIRRLVGLNYPPSVVGFVFDIWDSKTLTVIK